MGDEWLTPTEYTVLSLSPYGLLVLRKDTPSLGVDRIRDPLARCLWRPAPFFSGRIPRRHLADGRICFITANKSAR